MKNPLSPSVILPQVKPALPVIHNLEADRQKLGFFEKRRIASEVENCRKALLRGEQSHIIGVGAKLAYFVGESFVKAGWKCETLPGFTWVEVTPENYSKILTEHWNGATTLRFSDV